MHGKWETQYEPDFRLLQDVHLHRGEFEEGRSLVNLDLGKERIPAMDKNVSRRDEVLKGVEDQLRMVGERRATLSKELAELDQHRNDLRSTLDILEHQTQCLQQVLERANSPVSESVDYDTVTRERPMNTTVARKW